MTQVRKDFQGCGEVQAFPGARVEAMGDGIQLALGIARQVRALGQVLAQQAVGVLVGPAWPGAVRIGEDELDREPLGQPLVLGPLFSPIIGQGFSQQCGHVPKLVREPVAGTLRVRARHPCQEDQPRGPFHQCPDRRPIAGPLDEVAFPVARYGAGRDLGGAFDNRRHVGDLAASIRPSRPRSACLARLTHRRQQLAPQRTAWPHIQAYIDGLGREVFPPVVRIRASEASRTLFGRAALSQRGPHILPQPGIQEFPSPPRLMDSRGRQCLRGAGPIGTTLRGVAGIFAADRAGSSSQHAGHHPQRMAMGHAQAQCLTVFCTHVSIKSLYHGNTLA